MYKCHIEITTTPTTTTPTTTTPTTTTPTTTDDNSHDDNSHNDDSHDDDSHDDNSHDDNSHDDDSHDDNSHDDDTHDDNSHDNDSHDDNSHDDNSHDDDSHDDSSHDDNSHDDDSHDDDSHDDDSHDDNSQDDDSHDDDSHDDTPTTTSTATATTEFCEVEKAGVEKTDDFYEDAPIGQTITVLDPTSEGQKLAGLTINQTQNALKHNTSDDTHFFKLEVSFQGTQLDLNDLFQSGLDFQYLPFDVETEPLELKANGEFLVDNIAFTLIDRINDTQIDTRRLSFEITMYKCHIESSTSPETTVTTTNPGTKTIATTGTATTGKGNIDQIKLEPSTVLLSTTSPNYPANNCIDEEAISLCSTKKEDAPWFAIDYGHEVSVGKVILDNRGEDIKTCPTSEPKCYERTAAVEIRLSNELPTDGNKMFFTDGTIFCILFYLHLESADCLVGLPVRPRL